MSQKSAVARTPEIRPIAVLRECALGWVIDLQDVEGHHILSSAAYPSKFLADEALAKILKRQVQSTN